MNKNKMQHLEGVAKMCSNTRGRKKNIKRNSLTAEILQEFGNCKNNRRAKNKTREIYKLEMEAEVQTFQMQALEIAQPGPEFDPNATPQDGMEYLMKMNYERERCPVIVQCPLPDSTESSNIIQTAEADAMTTSFEKATGEVSQNKFLTTPEWIHAQTCTFLKARAKVTFLRLKGMEGKAANSDLPTQATEETDWQQFCMTHTPTLSLILQFGQRAMELLLEYLSNWLQECSGGLDEHNDELELLDSTKSEMTCELLGNKRWLGLWIYATLVCLELPLEPQVHSSLREIARCCIQLRSRLAADEESMAQQYNVFVAIIACVFEQYDFKEFL